METTSEAGAMAALPWAEARALPWAEARALPWAEATAAPLDLLRFICSPSMLWPKTLDWCFS